MRKWLWGYPAMDHCDSCFSLVRNVVHCWLNGITSHISTTPVFNQFHPSISGKPPRPLRFPSFSPGIKLGASEGIDPLNLLISFLNIPLLPILIGITTSIYLLFWRQTWSSTRLQMFFFPRYHLLPYKAQVVQLLSTAFVWRGASSFSFFLPHSVHPNDQRPKLNLRLKIACSPSGGCFAAPILLILFSAFIL